MTAEEQSDDLHLSTSPQGGDENSVDSGQMIAGGGHVPKIRKPYTITKQRERWTQEEHKKFLEALKLYGRAWRKIEEHVGTKTAVQIRSHAQKFFSKVVRETNYSDCNIIKPIEIPPPRPKKKPMHPYPRKLVLPTEQETVVDLHEHPTRWTSPNSSADQENKSPTSVLSAIMSDSSGCANSSVLPDGRTSADMCSPSNEDDSTMQEHYCQSDDPSSLKLELFPEVETSAKARSTKILKLFGKTVTVIDGGSPPSPTGSKQESKKRVGGVDLAPSQQGPGQLAGFPMVNDQSSPSIVQRGMPPGIFYANAETNPACAFHGQYPFIPFIKHLTTSPVEDPNYECKPRVEDPEEENVQRESSWTWTGSDSGWVSNPQSRDVETQCHPLFVEVSESKKGTGKKSALMFESGGSFEGKLKGGYSEKHRRGFVPYRRCLSEKSTQLSTITAEVEKEMQRRRLCL